MFNKDISASQNRTRPDMPSLDEDDDDICPVCDGDCTCHPAQSSYQPPSPHQRPILKIKLPPQPKQQTTSVFAHDGALHPPPPPKRRGRPPKNPHAAASSSTYQRPKPSATNRRPPPPKKSSAKKKTALKRKRVESSDSSDLTDADTIDDLEPPSQFPTFLPASALPSIASTSSADEDSDSSSSSGSDFDTDSSIEAEEENFIVSQEERARVRRELFGEESLQKRRDNRNDNWVIRPRKTSVGASSDVDMDVDSDATEDDDEDDDEEEEEGDDDEDDEDGMDGSAAGPYTYSGLATSWSDEEDEESSFDADLFFANLSESSDLDSGSSTQSDAGQDGDQSDLEGIAATIIPHLRQQGLIDLPFEVAEGWDGQVVFTNGIAETPFGYLDAPDFGLIAPPEMSASPSAEDDTDVVMTSTDADADEEGYEQDVDADTAEGEGDGDTTDEDLVGDDDLPNERAMMLFNTPFSFSSLSSINPLSTMSPVATSRRRNDSIDSSIDFPRPADILAGRLSTVIWEDSAEEHDRSDEHNEMEDPFEKGRREKDKRGGLPRAGTFEVQVPDGDKKARQAIIDDQHREVPSPHPRFRRGIGHGLLGKGRHRMSLSQSSTSSGYDSVLQRSLGTLPLRTSSLPPLSTRFPISSDLPVPSYISDAPLDVTSPGHGDISPTMPIDLSDVLDPSFLASADPPETPHHTETSLPPPDTPTPSLSGVGDMSSTDTEDQLNQRHMRNLDRWDLISVGAFRRTREAIVVGSPGPGPGPGPGYVSDVPATPGGWSDSDYGYNRYQSVMRASPLTTMLWHNKNGQKLQQMQKSGPCSPELLPLGGSSKDGDRTLATAVGTGSGLQPAFMMPKSKKELKKERKLKSKNGAGAHASHRHTTHQQQRHQHHHTSKMRQHHSHNHYGNTKSRSTGSVQRFFSSPVPSLSI